MKQINSLIVVEIPKDATDFKIEDLPILETCLTYEPATMQPLPPGQYEIIGLYSEVEEPKVSMILRMSHALVWEIKGAKDFMLRWLNKKYQVPIPTDTTDLLFIHKLK